MDKSSGDLPLETEKELALKILLGLNQPSVI